MGKLMVGAILGAGLLALAPACKKESRSVFEHRLASPAAAPSTPPMRQMPTGESALPPGNSQGGEAAAATAPADQYAVEVVGALHQDNLNEIQFGKLAQDQGQALAVKQYGAMLVSEHSEADQKLSNYAIAKTIPLNRGDTAQKKLQEGRDAAAKLRVLEGNDFDRAFARMMVDDHQKAIDLVNTARAKVSDPDLRALLAEVSPVLEKHLEHARTLASDQANATGGAQPGTPTRAQGRRPVNR